MNLATGIGGGWESGRVEDYYISALGPDHLNETGLLLHLCAPLRDQNFRGCDRLAYVTLRVFGHMHEQATDCRWQLPGSDASDRFQIG
jgi:hypothetical protein